MDILGFEKLIYHRDKLDKLARGEKQFPIHVTLSLGNYCNHKCLWCTAYEYQLDKAKMIDFDQLLDWLTRARDRGLKAVGYVGNGEPTAYPRFAELVKAVHDLGIEQGMFTNGYLLDRYEQEILDYFTYLRISLDAGSSEMHAWMHDVRAQHYPKIMENLSSILTKRTRGTPTIGIQYATHHHNLSDLYKAAGNAAEIGADYFSVKPVFNRGSVGERIDKNNLTYEDITPIVAKARQDFESRGFTIYYRPHQILSEEADRNVLQYDRCVAGFFNLNVYEDGAVIYCGPHRIPVGTMDDDLDRIEDNILALSSKLDLSKCPGGCRYHGMNHLVHTVLNPEAANQYHKNFL
ncbi:radical SAM protein [Nisaea sp.]|uniref:radical SAM protein n=1 Tax=Nisaea sp. TaxID=2024842 RepID=UPI003B5213B8